MKCNRCSGSGLLNYHQIREAWPEFAGEAADVLAALEGADLACEHSLTAERALYEARDLVAHLAMTLNELRALATDAGEFATKMRAEVEARGAAVLGAAGADGDA